MCFHEGGSLFFLKRKNSLPLDGFQVYLLLLNSCYCCWSTHVLGGHCYRSSSNKWNMGPCKMHLMTADVSASSLLGKALIYLYLFNIDNISVQDVLILAIYNMKSFWQTHLCFHIIPLSKNNDDIPNLNVT